MLVAKSNGQKSGGGGGSVMSSEYGIPLFRILCFTDSQDFPAGSQSENQQETVTKIP